MWLDKQLIRSFLLFFTSSCDWLSGISTAVLILHMQHPFCQSHSVKGPQSAHIPGSLLFSSLQLATGTSCNKHSNWTILCPSLHSETQSWTLFVPCCAATMLCCHVLLPWYVVLGLSLCRVVESLLSWCVFCPTFKKKNNPSPHSRPFCLPSL